MKTKLASLLGVFAVMCFSLFADSSGMYTSSGQNMGTVSMPFTVFGTRLSSSDTHTFYFTSHSTGTYRLAIDPSFSGMRAGMSVTVSGQMSNGDYTLGTRTTDLPTSSCSLSLTANKKYKVVISGGSFTGSYSYYFSIGKTGLQVTYDANGGSFPALIQTIGTSFNYTLDTMYGYLPTPTPPDGGTFLGWYTATSGGSAVFEMSTVLSGQSRLYAQYYFIPKFYYVAFNSNGGAGSMANQMHQYGVAQALTRNSFTKSGSTFRGWSTYPGGPVAYADGASVKSLTSVEYGTVTLYAVWVTPVKITFNSQGGDMGVSTSDYYPGDAMGQLPVPTKPGYTFTGWYDSAEGGARALEADLVSAARTLYAQWMPNVYTVSFVYSKEEGVAFSTNYAYGSSYGELPEVSSDTAYFAGWHRSTDGMIVSPTTQVVPEDHRLTARWMRKNPTHNGVDFSFYCDYVEVAEGDSFVVCVQGGCEDHASSVKVYLSYQTASAADVNLGQSKFPITLTWEAGEICEKQIVIETKQDEVSEAEEALTLQLAESQGMDISSCRNMTVFIHDDDVMASLQESINCPGVKVSTGGDGKWFVAKGDCYSTEDIGSYHAESPHILPGRSSTLSLGGFSGMTYLYYSLRFVGEETGLVSASVRIYDGDELIDTFWHSTYGDEWQNWVLTLPKETHDLKFVYCQGLSADVHAELCSVMVSHTSPTMDDLCIVSGAVLHNAGLVTGGGTVPYGTNVRLTATARPGWKFDAWYTLNNDLSYSLFWDKSASIDMTATTYFSVMARFWKIPYVRALADPANGGAVTGSGYYADGQKFSLSATPAKNFYFGGWYLSDLDNQNICGDVLLSKEAKFSDTVNCPSNMTTMIATLYAKFIPHPVASASFDSSMGSVAGTGSFAPGKKVSLKATAGKNYVFSGWYCDAEYAIPVSDDYLTATYTFEMGTDNVECYAKFIPISEDQAAVSLTLRDEYETGAAIEIVNVDVLGCKSTPTVKIGILPTGLKYDAKSNTISGTPTKSGVYTVVATVTTAGKKTASASQVVVVRKAGEKIVKLVVPEVEGAVPGKVVGAGIYTKGKKVSLKATADKKYVFSGWYADVDYHYPVEGDYLAASYSFTMGDADVIYYARFIPIAEDQAGISFVMEDEYETGKEMTPVVLNLSGCRSTPTVKTSPLPAGMKFTAKELDVKASGKSPAAHYAANTIYGTPTKSGVYTITVTAMTAGKQTASASQVVVVRKADEKIVKLEVPSVEGKIPGTATGAGIYAKGKKVSVKATANKSYVFAGWYDGETLLSNDANWSFSMGEADLGYTAEFITNEEDREAITLTVNGASMPAADVFATNLTCGVMVNWPILSDGLSATTVKSTPLPAGLKLVQDKTTKAYSVTGVPTAASKTDKQGNVQPTLVKFTVTTAGKNSREFQMQILVDALPASVVGSYAGTIGRGDNDAWMAYGTITFTVAANGKISAKVIAPSGSYSFAASGWDSFVDGMLSVDMVTKKNETLSLSLDVERDWRGPRISSRDKGNLFVLPEHEPFGVEAWRNELGKDGEVWNDPVARDIVNRIIAQKTLYVGITGNKVEGYGLAIGPKGGNSTLTLAITFDAKGNVKYSGVVDGVKVSGSTFLRIDNDRAKFGYGYYTVFDFAFPVGKTEVLYLDFGYDRSNPAEFWVDFNTYRVDFE